MKIAGFGVIFIFLVFLNYASSTQHIGYIMNVSPTYVDFQTPDMRSGDLGFLLPCQVNYSVDLNNNEVYLKVLLAIKNYGWRDIHNVKIMNYKDITDYKKQKIPVKANVILPSKHIGTIKPGKHKEFVFIIHFKTTEISEKTIEFIVEASGSDNTGRFHYTNMHFFVMPFWMWDFSTIIYRMKGEKVKSAYLELENLKTAERSESIANKGVWSDFVCTKPDGTKEILPSSIMTHNQVDFYGKDALHVIWETGLRTLEWRVNFTNYHLPIGTVCTNNLSHVVGWVIYQEENNYNVPVLIEFKSNTKIIFESKCENPLNLIYLFAILFLLAGFFFKSRRTISFMIAFGLVLFFLAVFNILSIYNLFGFEICIDVPFWILFLIIFIILLFLFKQQVKKK